MRLSARSFLLLALVGSFALPASGCKPEEESDHGYVKVLFRRADSEDSSPFVGTQEVEINLFYSPCLVEFYNNMPNYKQDGIEGAPIYAEFGDDDSKKGLCRQKDPTRSTAQCETLSIVQDTDNNRQTTRYRINDADMEDKVLFFGPVPCVELTGCAPILTAGGASGNGFGSGGTNLWHTSSFPERDGACGQGRPIELNISR